MMLNEVTFDVSEESRCLEESTVILFSSNLHS